jgi:EAL domain-containing protein (putative c-di-GMP-specific phosphodiesterase class I)
VTYTTLLEEILAPGSLSTVVQPIMLARPNHWVVHGFECLTRGPAGTNIENPGVLFDYVRRKRAESPVDRACIRTALKAAGRLPQHLGISVNVHASSLGCDHEFSDFLSRTASAAGIDMERLTVEVIESTPFWDKPGFRKNRKRLLDLGVRLAVDDLGAGYSTYQMLLETMPEYFKVDGYIVRGIHDDPHRMAVLESIVALADRFGATVIAEGVETEQDLFGISQLAIPLAQGYLFSPPVSVSCWLKSSLAHAREGFAISAT